MALSETDRILVQSCLARRPRAWEGFVDRYMGLVVHVVNHSAQTRSRRLSAEDREDLIAQVFLAIVRDNLALLRQFRGESSLATYLTVVARRVVVRELLKQKAAEKVVHGSVAADSQNGIDVADAHAEGSIERLVSDREEIERLLRELDEAEAAVVRLYHLEGKSYQEISDAVGMPENTVGPTLSRARRKMRQADV